MEILHTHTELDLAGRLKQLRKSRNWSLDELAAKSDVSRATLSRIEKDDVSPTAHVLGKLCAAYGMTLSRLIALAEVDFVPILKRADQSVWVDAASGFHRRSVSPPSNSLAGEVLECTLSPECFIEYPSPPTSGLEHHLILLEGELDVEIEGIRHALQVGDCLRYKLYGCSSFRTHRDIGARYNLVVI
ncbi:MAG: helix-turn-helix domain-containing protein [Hyphomicrobiales bacterium]